MNGALIGMAVYSTAENQKDECLAKTLKSLRQTVNFRRHKLMLSVNGSTDHTKFILDMNKDIISKVFWNKKNLGTAEGINKIWQERNPGQHAAKMDDDIVIHSRGWLDEMIEAIERHPVIGQIGLKRKDCWETPIHESDDLRSKVTMVPHVSGQRWIFIEEVKHVIGSCVLHSSALLDKVGYLRQNSEYGYDDVIMSHRSQIAGFTNCFLSHVEIDHVDDGFTPYQDWKQKHSAEQTQAVIDLVHKMYNNQEPIYYNPFQ